MSRARMSTTARALCVLATVLIATSLAPRRAAASIFGEESAILGGILNEEIAQLAQMVNTVQGIMHQIQQLKTMIAQGNTLLKGVSKGNLASLVQMLNWTSRVAKTIDNDIKFIGYKLGTVDQQREAVYQSSLRGVPPKQFRAKALKWNSALMESSNVAMRAQTNVAELQERAQVQQQVLMDSQSADGVVGQLQLVVRGLAVLHADLDGVQRTLDTGMRVTANMAAGQAAAGAMIEEEHVLSVENYTDPGPAVSVPHQLPRFE
jgi:P-type conjugative transfer protein TrbJ